MVKNFCVVAVLAFSWGWAGEARAETVLELSGSVGLADGAVPSGTAVRLKLDLDRDGEFASFETLTGSVNASGTYSLNYDLDPSDVDFEFVTFVGELLLDYQSRGFEALIDQGPLPAIISFEREGYSTITRKISTMIDNPQVDALLTPLVDIHCSDEGCQSANGAVKVSGFPGGTGIARAYAEAYDPSQGMPKFPGSFSDSTGNLLLSSGFMEIDFRDASGKRVTKVSTPVTVRYEADENSWPTLRDLVPGNDRIDVPMYSFDETIAEWVREADGVLEDENGDPIEEDQLADIKDGSYDGRVFIAFSTTHFSTFNCDAPIEERACVKGRLIDELGNALPGLQVSVHGVTYTGTAGTLTTGLEGRFATDLWKSEAADEDIDDDGTTGETFRAEAVVTSSLGVFVGAAFDTPSSVGTSGQFSPNCKPEACECFDLGDITVVFEPPRVCTVTVHATFSGASATGDAELEAGDPVVGASARGELAGSLSLPQSAIFPLCEGVTCLSGTIDADGTATFVVPVVGDSPAIELSAEFQTTIDGAFHYYTGSVQVDGCARGETELEASVELELSHVALGSLSEYISALGAGPVVSGSGGGSSGPGIPGINEPAPDPTPKGCGCRQAGVHTEARGALPALLALLGLALRRRSRSTASA